jgi:predicted MarR family transcription regulator
MILTFAQYNTLVATGMSATCEQVTSRTAFDSVMVRYSIAILLSNGLITAVDQRKDGTTSYRLTEFGASCIADYELHNPALKVTPSFNAEEVNA